MWIVRLALRRPYTVAIMSLLILVLGILSLSRMIVDIFPVIDIPVVAVVWNYPGLSPEDMERRVVLISERAYSTTVNGIERVESQSIPGVGMLKIYFQPGTDIGAAIAQISSVSSTILRLTPPGMQPPNVIQFNASNVPVAQMTLSSKTLGEDKIFDYGLNFIRIRLFTIPGLSAPAPFGGQQREILIDVDARALNARGLSPADVVNALQSSNVILPAGTAKIGSTEWNVLTNSSPRLLDEFRQIPIKVVGSAPVYIGDVARVADAYAEQTNMVHVNGKRATYLAILKHADASTLAVVDAAKEAIPSIKQVAPKGLDIKLDFDQSVFVRGAIEGVLREAVVSSVLVSLMILIFLGSWRSVIIVCTSIPLAIFTAIIGLNLTGNTINLMTLGGLALAIGMLVDDATVEVENIHRNRGFGKPLTVAILDGAQQIAVPAIVATLAICIVFFPVVLLFGPAKYLFTPLALGVVLAMLASYLLSRTLVPSLARMMMENEPVEHHDHTFLLTEEEPEIPSTFWGRINQRRERGFQRLQDGYGSMLRIVLAHRVFALATAVLIGIISFGLVFVIGRDFFPQVDAGIMKLHFRAPKGMRIEETEKVVLAAEDRIRQIIPAGELDTINDMIGVPLYYNLAFVQTDNTSAMDSEITISLKSKHHPTAEYRRRIREELAKDFPGTSSYFQSADIVSQVLNFGLSSPLDVQVEDPNLDRAYGYAARLRDGMQRIPGTVDVHIDQVLDYPTLQVDIDRTRAAQLGLTQRDVATSMLTSLSSSSLVSPSYYLNPQNNVNYVVAVQIPPRKIESVGNLRDMPLTPGSTVANVFDAGDAGLPGIAPGAPSETLGNVAKIYQRVSAEKISHYTVQRVLDINANIEGRDLGSVASQIQKLIDGLGQLPAGMHIRLRGQNEVMVQSFRSLGLGLILAIILVYSLMVVLFQSWTDPFIIMMAVPGAVVGILWMLAITGTTINVESLMGSIMAVGIATSNSILLVSFANDYRIEHGASSLEAAYEAGKTRLRPVLMTALAMIIGMMPMALGLGEAGEQNAPLGRAVIGGLLMATVVTLFVVPVIYTFLRKSLPTKHLLEERFQSEAAERNEAIA